MAQQVSEGARRGLEQVLSTRQTLGSYPDGPLHDCFDPLRLAEALEQQAERALLLFDCPKVDVRMDAVDALALASWLRQAPGRR